MATREEELINASHYIRANCMKPIALVPCVLSIPFQSACLESILTVPVLFRRTMYAVTVSDRVPCRSFPMRTDEHFLEAAISPAHQC